MAARQGDCYRLDLEQRHGCDHQLADELLEYADQSSQPFFDWTGGLHHRSQSLPRTTT